jgi:hypothetical protein
MPKLAKYCSESATDIHNDHLFITLMSKILNH